MVMPLFAQNPRATAARPANDGDFTNAQKTLIRQLHADKRYFDCIAETRRLLEYARPNEADQASYRYFIDVNYFLGGQYRTVFENVLKRHDDRSAYAVPSSILSAQALFSLGRDGSALDELSRWDYAALTERDRRELFFRRSEFLLRSYRYAPVIDEIAKTRSLLPTLPAAAMSEELARHRDAGRKVPWLAAVMSAALPGSGQAYAGKYLAGIISLAGVAVTSYGAYHFHSRGEWNLAYTCGFFAALFYGGTVYGAHNAARDANRNADDAFNRAFIKQHIPPYRPAAFMDRQAVMRP